MSFVKTKTIKSLALPPALWLGKESDSRRASFTMREHTCRDDVLVLCARQTRFDGEPKLMEINVSRAEAVELARSFAELAEYMAEKGM